MHPRVYGLTRAVAAASIILALLVPTAFAEDKSPAGGLKPANPGQSQKADDNKKPADTAKPAAPAQSQPAGDAKKGDDGQKPADTAKPSGGQPAATDDNTRGKSPSNPDGAGVSKPYSADGQPAGSQGTGSFDGNNGCGQEKKAGGPPDPQGGYDDNNGNCGAKPKTAGPVASGLSPGEKATGSASNGPGCAFGNDQKNGQTMTAPGCAREPNAASPADRTVVAVETLVIQSAAAQPIFAAGPVAAIVTTLGSVTLANGASMPLPPGTIITVAPGVQVAVLTPPTDAIAPVVLVPASTTGPAAVAGVSFTIPAGTVVIAAGIGTVTLSEPLEVVLGEQVLRAVPLQVLPSSLPRTGGLGALGGLLGIVGLATTVGGAYLRRRGATRS